MRNKTNKYNVHTMFDFIKGLFKEFVIFSKEKRNTIIKLFITLMAIAFALYFFNINLTALNSPESLFIVVAIQISGFIAIIIYLYFLWFKSNPDNALIRNIIILIPIVFLISFPVCYILLSFGRSISNVDGVKIGSADGWIGFIGSLIGGIITMLAVIFTIQNENRKRTLDERNRNEREIIRILPIIDIIPYYIQSENSLPEYLKGDEGYLVLASQNNSYSQVLPIIKISNLSENGLSNLKILSCNLKLENYDNPVPIELTQLNNFSNIIAGNKYTLFRLNLNNLLSTISTIEYHLIEFELNIDVEYHNILKSNILPYKCNFVGDFSIRVNKKDYYELGVLECKTLYRDNVFK